MTEELFGNLEAAINESKHQGPVLIDDPNFLCAKRSSETKDTDLLHIGLTDSSEDEDHRDFQSSKYNEYGREVKYLLSTTCSSSSLSSTHSRSSSWSKAPPKDSLEEKQLQLPQVAKDAVPDVYSEPIFGMRIIKPLISSALLKERMQGRVAIPLNRLRSFVESIPPQTDWVVGGVIVHKTGLTSQKGNPFSIWTLSDLHGELKTMSLFLFGSAYKELWKSLLGTAVSVLNPSVFEKKQGSKDEAVLSVDNVQKVLILGQSKDFGTCKSTRKDGTPCTSFVNLSKCEYCIYHVRQEYQKASKRSDLQSAYSGRGLTALRNKVLGKNEVFYAGKSYTAVAATKSKKLQAKDASRLESLKAGAIFGTRTSSLTNNRMAPIKRAGDVQHVEISAARRKKDLELLKKLRAGDTKSQEENDLNASEPRTEEAKTLSTSASVSLKESRSTALHVISMLKMKKKKEDPPLKDLDFTEETGSANGKENTSEAVSAKMTLKLTTIQKLGYSPPSSDNSNPVLACAGNKLIDLSVPICKKKVSRANVNALKFVQKNGPIKKQDPNSVKAMKTSKKRVLDVVEKQERENSPKRQKIQQSEHFSQRFKQMMAATSAHKDLLANQDEEDVAEYFDKLEAKERMEEKLISTHKVQCKAVKCLQCKYTAFSSADRCKQEKHPLKVFDATKRFFKCGDCDNRTVSLNVIPMQACKNCGSSKWERAGMMKERIVGRKAELSIRGGEQTFVNSNISNANVNLLVPED